MPTITSLTPSPRKQGRFVVEVDGKPFAVVSLDVIERLHLASGTALVPQLEDALRREAEALKTYDRALDLLAIRARSAGELRRQLVRKGEPVAHVDAAIARLREAGLLDDAAYARQFARSKVLGAGHSRRRLQQELFRKGVDREVADDAIAEVLEDEEVDTDAIIERVARRKAQALRNLDPAVRSRRLWAFLARRGYDSDDIRKAIEAVTGQGIEDVSGAANEEDEEESED